MVNMERLGLDDHIIQKFRSRLRFDFMRAGDLSADYLLKQSEGGHGVKLKADLDPTLT